MADRKSAEIFAMVLDQLAKNPTDEMKQIASNIWSENHYDFSACQMCADEAMIKLGLAKMGIDPNEPEEGERVLYLGEDY